MAMQSKQMLKVVTDIITNAGRLDELETSAHFHIKVESEGFMPLSIESWKENDRRFFSVSHYFEQNGDLVADPDILMDGNGTPWHIQQVFGFQQLVEIRDGKMYSKLRQIQDVVSFMNMWARNIKAQGFVKIAKELKKA